MTPKDKAKYLVKLFVAPTLIDFSDDNFETTKQCALICVDEILANKGLDTTIMIMTLIMGDGVVGRCVKYVDDMVHWCKENMVSELDFDIFNKRIYPMGFPNF